MKTFKQLLIEERKIGKKMSDMYVHKDYVDKTSIPKDIYNNALSTLKKNHPDFSHTIVKHNPKNNNISFLHSPDWDTAHEPHIHDSVLVTPEGTSKYSAPKKEKQIYHQKWAFVGDDYKGFDVERSKLRTKQYQKAVDKVKQLKNDPTVSKKIGYKSYWDKEIVPHIED